MYPDDHLILEGGIWRPWNLSLDEPYFEMPNWKAGWAGAKERAPACATCSAASLRRLPRRPAAPRWRQRAGNTGRGRSAMWARRWLPCSPDVPITELGKLQEHFRGGTGEPWDWPKILPMWWGYKNPVSGRRA